MKKNNAKARFSKRRLDRFITELCSLAKDLCPDAEIELQPGIEELDARIEIVVPDEREEEVSDKLVERSHEIFMDEGYDIGVSVYERSRIEKVRAQAQQTGS